MFVRRSDSVLTCYRDIDLELRSQHKLTIEAAIAVGIVARSKPWVRIRIHYLVYVLVDEKRMKRISISRCNLCYGPSYHRTIRLKLKSKQKWKKITNAAG